MSERTQRRLAAIVSADVVGYSRLMGADEDGTLAALKAHRNAIDPLIFSHGGRIVKTTGDGLFLEYPTVVAAVLSCLEIQKTMAERDATLPHDRRMQFRIGVHLGEVIVDNDDLFGDVVNIAARLQELAEPGGISLSSATRDAVHQHIEPATIDLGSQKLKNIVNEVHIWRIDMGQSTQAGLEAAAARGQFERSAIAVLPFDNMSNDPEQAYFVDGITEDLITSLSRLSGLRVIARNSTFSYKGQAKDVRLIAAELDARYVLEGSVRKAGNRYRINAQLIDAVSGQHIWAERYDREPKDIFDLQDDITANIVARAAPEVWRAEGNRLRRYNVAQLDAWDLFLRARFAFNDATEVGFEQSEALCRRAIELDPNYAPAHMLLSQTLFQFLVFGYRRGSTASWQQVCDLGEKSTRLDPNDAVSLAFYAATLAHMGQYDKALELSKLATTLNSGSSHVLRERGRCQFHCSQYEAATETFERDLQLSPSDPLKYTSATLMGFTQCCLRRHDAALSWAEEALRLAPAFIQARGLHAASLAQLGRLDAAKASIDKFLKSLPHATASRVARNFRLRNQGDVDHYRDGLKEAGLPL